MKIKIAKYLYNNKKINNGIEKQKKNNKLTCTACQDYNERLCVRMNTVLQLKSVARPFLGCQAVYRDCCVHWHNSAKVVMLHGNVWSLIHVRRSHVKNYQSYNAFWHCVEELLIRTCFVYIFINRCVDETWVDNEMETKNVKIIIFFVCLTTIINYDDTSMTCASFYFYHSPQ